ncbi:ABC transporter substrate-binding protein [Candidatus Parabeggiatoa sp. HSG14]|uniref:ABC transporter substrate-binding protein n=1 Tax=Candidatus Parabeggiatoa sp. HSG14 TaxID=3055593 RepID=UPI0025A8FE0E|nr:ABC transporter substrate-binding protein [Thiotrichales bacterium HSG14]
MNTSQHNLQGKSILVFILLIIGLIIIVIGSLELLSLLKIKPSLPSPLATRTEINTISFPRQLKDATGNTLIIPKRPQRIVSQTLGTDEILLALCPANRIVAVSTLALNEKYSNVVEKARTIPGQTTLNVEHILDLNPDLIFVASYNQAETIELLQTTGAPVFRFANFNRIDDIKNNIKTIGYAIGEDKRVAALITKMEEEIKAIRVNFSPLNTQPPRVMLYDQWHYTAGSNTLFDDMLQVLGAINVAANQGIKGHIKISDEQIIEWQPDFIVTGSHYDKFEEVRRQLRENPTIAVSNVGKKSGRIIVIDNRHLTAVSQYIIYGIRALAQDLF